MDTEITGDASVTGHESIAGVASHDSYNDNVIAPTDSASVASNSVTLPQSPARSTLSVPTTSPVKGPSIPSAQTSSTNTPRISNPFVPSRAQNFDLLDATGTSFPNGHPSSYPTTGQRSGGGGFTSSDDDQTEPSSSATGITAENPSGYTRSDYSASAISTFGRLIENTKRRLNPGEKSGPEGDDDDDDDDDGEEDTFLKSALIYGYLKKLGRNGKWQTRWFESDGECLTYYKSSKRNKLLATLDLAKVGSIRINHEDENGTTFTINISQRPYQLRADSKAACRDWVIMLNRVKEARMHEGNVKLLVPSANPPDLLDESFTPRVVVIANRQRTRAVDSGEIESWENAPNWNANPANEGSENYLASSSRRLARWQKPRNSLSRLASKLMNWARSIRKYGCTDVENQVVLDHHLHPPGHDDQEATEKVSRVMADGSEAEKLSTDRAKKGTSRPHQSTISQATADDDDEIRHLS